ncbi:hypothetical protein [Pseudomonas sp.]|uniref:hypothetical protein n=1 Tax=Pseudomonas sp. TaxID=306 RepID=UPI0028AE8B20|nr:hypothetical protein [Pseudomonas sp.]
MKFKLLVLLVFVAHANAEEIAYSKISEAQSVRYGKNLIRYFQVYGEPCTYFQLIDSKNKWNVATTKKFCSLDGKSFWTDFSDTAVTGIKISDDGISIDLSITPLEPTGEQKKKCFMPVSAEAFGAVDCESVETED